MAHSQHSPRFERIAYNKSLPRGNDVSLGKLVDIMGT